MVLNKPIKKNKKRVGGVNCNLKTLRTVMFNALCMTSLEAGSSSILKAGGNGIVSVSFVKKYS